MRSITSKAICTLLITALVLGFCYWAVTSPFIPSLLVPETSVPSTPSSSVTMPGSSTTIGTSSTIPSTSTIPGPTVTIPQPTTTIPIPTTTVPLPTTTIPVVPTTQPTAPTTQPTTPTTQPTAPTTQPTAPTTQPTAPTTQPTAPTTQPTAPTTQPTAPTTQPTVPPVEYPEPPTLNAKEAFIFDCASNDYLYRTTDSYGAVLYPASITKLFTCYIAMQYLSIDEEILLGYEQYLYPKDTSRAYFEPGETISVYGLLHGALLPSGCDAVYALVATAGRRILNDPDAGAQAAIDAFVVEMNRQAKLLGMGATNFVTPDGSHREDHVVSLHAFVIIARCAMSNPHILDACGKYAQTISYKDSTGKTVYKTLMNTNYLLNPDSSYYTPEAVGMKTGSTNAAGKCVLSLFRDGDHYVIIGVFGCSADRYRWQDSRALWEYYKQLKPLIE